ncbi:hypothetical protein LZP73_07710 [Shewanella sp. AS16]|uniref:hypothetical protein n=1 Tax=Shewanella sp. AS16 TaxID=2907625 RepID=UPI001F375EAD|nr:hypothetical protein [Shewanella sp. AS16]MCE9686101.1 hypothetical protein [Shewanella sp. AS16]
MNSQTQSGNRSKTMLVLLFSAFILPVAIAKLVLGMGLYQGGATNQGELLSPPLDYAKLAMTNPLPHSWQILYLLPAHCDQACSDRLYILHQSHIALGRDRDRVEPLIMTRADSDLAALAGQDFITAEASDELAAMLAQRLIIVDPLGSLVMGYPAVTGREAHLAQGKALLKDLHKLLKLSRVG